MRVEFYSVVCAWIFAGILFIAGIGAQNREFMSEAHCNILAGEYYLFIIQKYIDMYNYDKAHIHSYKICSVVFLLLMHIMYVTYIIIKIY